MNESELKTAVQSALIAALGNSPNRSGLLDKIEAELPGLMANQLPGTDQEAIIRTVRECVEEARTGN